MSGRFVDSIEPFLLAAQGRTLEGRLSIKGLKRLHPLVRATEGEVDYILHFERDESGIPCVTGKVEATLVLQCQRCMQDMAFPVSTKVRLGIVRTRQEAEQLPTNYEPLLVAEGDTTLTSIVEDELILALPIVAMHRQEDCAMEDMALAHAGQDQKEDATGTGRQNPFAILATLKKELNSESTPQSAIENED